MKVAIVHEFLNQYGGAERVLEAIHELYPQAVVYTLIYDPDSMPIFYKAWDIRESPSLTQGWIRRHYKSLFFLYPLMMEQFDLREYDLVITSSYAYAHGILTSPNTCHICYCHTPMRFVWSQVKEYRAKMSRFERPFYEILIHLLRLWDQSASGRPDSYIAASRNVAQRIERYYRRESIVIHPPVDLSQFQPSSTDKDYFLLVSRLVMPYKRIDIAIDAFNRLGLSLKIVGDGSDRVKLQGMAKPNIEFLGACSGPELVKLYAECKALIFPGEDDFGIVPLEANSCGRPVIAYGKGGILESQIEGITALYFTQLSSDALIEIVQQFGTYHFDKIKIRESALRFDKSIFKKNMSEYIQSTLRKHAIDYNIPMDRFS